MNEGADENKSKVPRCEGVGGSGGYVDAVKLQPHGLKSEKHEHSKE